jgi:hypothetical protein
MIAPYLVTQTTVDLGGASTPLVWTVWHRDGTLSVRFDAAANQSIGFSGTPQEIRLALASGLAAVDRAVKEREAEPPAEDESAEQRRAQAIMRGNELLHGDPVGRNLGLSENLKITDGDARRALGGEQKATS